MACMTDLRGPDVRGSGVGEPDAGDPDVGGWDFGGTVPFTTWDGEPISREPPHGATIVVASRAPEGWRYVLLHRAHHGPDYAGDWAWTPPSGSRKPGEALAACAARELEEETGLRAAPQPVLTEDVGRAVRDSLLDDLGQDLVPQGGRVLVAAVGQLDQQPGRACVAVIGGRRDPERVEPASDADAIGGRGTAQCRVELLCLGHRRPVPVVERVVGQQDHGAPGAGLVPDRGQDRAQVPADLRELVPEGGAGAPAEVLAAEHVVGTDVDRHQLGVRML